MLAILRWLGQRARWVMALGVVGAVFVPALSALLAPFLPALVALVFALAVARLDLGPVLRRAATVAGVARLALWTGAFLVLTPALLWAAATALGLGPRTVEALVYTGAAPPITSSAALCLMLGLDALFALELTVVASLLTPLVAPVVAGVLLGDAVPLDPVTLGLRMAAMIGAGTFAGTLLRRVVGAETIARERAAFDGLAALAMVLFVVPLFDGVGRTILAAPGEALGVLALAVGANFGMQAAVAIGLARALRPRALPAGAAAVAPPPGTGGAAGLMWGNRTVAIWPAAMPADPWFQLYVALYQVPMLFTVLLMRRLLTR